MAAGSLVVRVSADINDFSRKMNAMTRDVNKAADTIAGIGKKLTIGITLPAIAAGAALAKMAVENQEVSRKMARVFGAATNSMQTDLDRFTKMVPVAGTDIQKMSIELAELADELGATGDQAREFARSALDISVKLAAAKGVDLAESVNAVSNAMKGQMKALKSLGVIVTEADVTQFAYANNLAKTGQELSSYANTLATVGVLMEKSNKWAGEVGASQANLGTQFRMAKVALSEFADATSSLLIPVLVPMANALKSIAEWLNNLAPETRKLILVLVALAAVVGPILIAIASLVKLIAAVAAAIGLIAAPVWLAIATGVGLLTAAIILLNKAFRDTPKSWMPSGWQPDVTYQNATPYPRPAARRPSSAGTNISAPASTFGGFGVRSSQRDEYAFGGAGNQSGNLMAVARISAEVAAQVTQNAAFQTVLSSLTSPNGMAVNAASRSTYTDASMRGDIANDRLRAEDMLRFREELVKLPPALDMTRIASLEFAEGVKDSSETFSAAVAGLKQQFASTGNIGAAAMNGVKNAASGLIKEFSIQALIMKIISDILSGIGPQLQTIFGLFKVMGTQLGYVLAPVFKLLYNIIRYVIIAFTWLSRIIVQFTASLLTGVGKLLQAIGNAINKLPGSLGNPIKKAGDALVEYGRSQYKLAGNLKKTQEQLQAANWEKALNGVDELGDAASKAAAELLNLPNRFKYALRAFNATQGANVGSGAFAPGSGPTQGGSGAPNGAEVGGALQINLHMDGKPVATAVLRNFRASAAGQFGDASRFTELSAL